MAQPPSATDHSSQLGERFARAVSDKDAAVLKSLLCADVDFKAMTPGRFWEAHDAAVVVDETMLGTWFAPDRRITETLAVDTATIASMHRVGYRFRVTRPDGEFAIEQQAYFRTDGDRISWLRVMCTGFLPLCDT